MGNGQAKSTYLIMLAVGEFNIVEDKFQDIPVQSFVGKNVFFDDAQFTFRNTAKMVGFFSDMLNYKYPWNKYAQITVEDFVYGGMENTSATVLIKRLIINPSVENDYYSDETISHELSHQWFGDLVTCRNWNEMWLNESFATYFASLWKENRNGKDDFDYETLREGDNAMRSDSLTGRYPIWAGYGRVTTNLYDKGAVILNSFRHILKEDFFPSITEYLKHNEYQNVESKDLLEAINKTYNTRHNSNEDFKWMFDQWIWKAGYPKFEVKYDYNESAKEVLLNVKQVQLLDSLTPVFRLPLLVRLKNSKEDKIQNIQISGVVETFRIGLNSKPDMVEFDYGNNFLDKTSFNKSFNDWKTQYYESENAIDRIMALRGLEIFLKEDNSPTAGKPPITIDQIASLKLFGDALNNDAFWGARAEAAKILSRNFIIDRTGNILRDSYEYQTDSRIKREILKALGKSVRSEDADFIQKKIKNESNVYILAEGINALGSMIPKEKIYEVVIPFAGIISHRNVVQAAVIGALVESDSAGTDQKVKEIIKNFAFGTDVDGRLRVIAINSLRKYAKDEEVKRLALKYMDYNFIVVKMALINLITASDDKSVIPLLRQLNEKTTDEGLNELLAGSIKKLEDLK